jgi:hypothetical protein
MMDRKPRPPVVDKNGWNQLDTPSLQSAIRTLGISRDQTTELQGYIKSLLDEHKDGDWKGTLELRIIWKYQHEWETWGEEALGRTQAAIRDCVTAIRLGIPLVQPQRHQSPPDAPEGSVDQNPGFDTNKPLPLTPRTRRGTPQTEDLSEQESAHGTYVRHLRGLHHEVLEIKETPRGSPKLVIVENSPFPGISAVIQSAEDDDDSDSPILGNAMLPTSPPQPSGLARNMRTHLPPGTTSRPLEATQRNAVELTKQMSDAFFGDVNRRDNVANHSVLRGHLGFATMPPTSSQSPAAMVSHQRDGLIRARHQPSSFRPDSKRSLTRLPSMPTQRRPPPANPAPRPTIHPSDNASTTTISRSKAPRKRSTSTPLHPVPHPLRTSTSASPSQSPSPSHPSILQTQAHPHAPGQFSISYPPPSTRLRRTNPLPSPLTTSTASAASSGAGSPA